MRAPQAEASLGLRLASGIVSATHWAAVLVLLFTVVEIAFVEGDRNGTVVALLMFCALVMSGAGLIIGFVDVPRTGPNLWATYPAALAWAMIGGLITGHVIYETNILAGWAGTALSIIAAHILHARNRRLARVVPQADDPEPAGDFVSYPRGESPEAKPWFKASPLPLVLASVFLLSAAGLVIPSFQWIDGVWYPNANFMGTLACLAVGVAMIVLRFR